LLQKGSDLRVKKLKAYRETDERQRARYLDGIKDISQKNIVYIDETGCDKYYYRNGVIFTNEFLTKLNKHG
jgi:hypothetical protein